MTPLAMTANCSSPPSSPRATPWRRSATLDCRGAHQWLTKQQKTWTVRHSSAGSSKRRLSSTPSRPKPWARA